jgi:two-component system osmolarity sensor histidine kinase EnvZ
MKFVPRTLLGRTALYLGLVMLISQVVWFASTAYFFARPIWKNYERQIATLVAMAGDLVASHSSPQHPSPADAPTLYVAETVRIQPDTAPIPEFDPDEDSGPIEDLQAQLRNRFGAEVMVHLQKKSPILWIRFPAMGRRYWLALPLDGPVPPYWALIGVGVGIAFSIAGAYLIIFNVTRQLRHITRAARAIGQGEPLGRLAEVGPQEVRDLSAGFNQMASDLNRLDSDRRLMLAGISHDLRTPLTRLRIAVDLLEADADPKLAQGLVRNIEDMDSILKQFLDYARDGSEEQPQTGDLDAIVADVCRRYGSAGSPVAFRAGGLPHFNFRGLAMRRVVTNLVDNAVRYGRAGVHVETRLSRHEAIVIVSDSGPGIRSGDPSEFVKPFAREDASRSESGAGLGLTIVDRVMRIHGGRLRLENRPTGGLLATIELPLDAA